jgi:hypothetical protein
VILPTSYTVSADLLNIDPHPFTGGGYGDVHQGTLNGKRVCIKRMRIFTGDDPKAAAKVRCRRRRLPYSINNEIYRLSAKRL